MLTRRHSSEASPNNGKIFKTDVDVVVGASAVRGFPPFQSGTLESQTAAAERETQN
jgi:hypothetical protein